MVDVALVFAVVLITVTLGTAFEYYRLLRKTKREYEHATEAVEDIVISINKQFKHEAERMDLVTFKMESLSTRTDSVIKEMSVTSKAAELLESKVASALLDKDKMLSRLKDIDNRVISSITSQKELTERISKLVEEAKQLPIQAEHSIEAVIPIKRDRALAPLTETEISVLELLVKQGPRTAPEIKEGIELSREHTARLMKKLYEGGYLERDTNRIPFRYSVKKEMEEFLKKANEQA